MGLPPELTLRVDALGWSSNTFLGWFAYTCGLVFLNCLQLYSDNTLDQQQRLALSGRSRRGSRALAVAGLTFLYDLIDVVETYLIANGNLWSVFVMLVVEFLYVAAMYAESPLLRCLGSLKRDSDALTVGERGELLKEQCTELIAAVNAMTDTQKAELARQLFPAPVPHRRRVLRLGGDQ